MRFTIRGRRATIARRDVRTYGLTRAESWRVDCLAARLDLGRPVHRERVRFGAWEARPRGLRSRVRVGGRWVDGPLCTIEWVHAPTGAPNAPAPVPAEGPADSDGSQTYKRPLWADSPDLAEETR